MTHALIAVASTHGHTAKIAERIASRMRDDGIDVDMHNVTAGPGADSIAADGVLVLGSIHREHHQPALVDWVEDHRDALAELPTTFVSVSLAAAEDGDESKAATQRMIDDFVEKTGWTPGRSVAVAGALQYREYDFFTRTLMRLLMRHMGHPTNTSRDYDYTDWDMVDRVADDFIASIAPTRAG
jgi:menaquinone-dependent protoporphyrinogen oxidase